MLGNPLSYWQDKQAQYTVQEICQQPATWKKTFQQIKEEKEGLQTFLQPFLAGDVDIIFSGGGTSEYVGNAIFSYVNRYTNYHAKSYASTDIVQAPQNYISKTKKTLMVHYGRSGNSPESVGSLEAADAIGKENVYHLIVTCHKRGLLSCIGHKHPRAYVLDLTQLTHDQSFVMTSSFTNMYLATLLCFRLDALDMLEKELDCVIEKTQHFLDQDYLVVKELVDSFDFKRIAYLGANVLKGISQEAQLKVCELTQGYVTTSFDSPLGFRHGPKSVINDETLIVMLTSGDLFGQSYDEDMIKELGTQRKKNQLVILSGQDKQAWSAYANYSVSFDLDTQESALLGLPYIVFAQVLALYKSISCGLSPDNPCPSGEVNRVVTGVTIYPYKRG